jgi:hypothetical protein
MPNKNIGEIFLLVWKFENSDIEEQLDGEMTLKRKNKHVSVIADFSIFSIIKIVAKVAKYPQFRNYREHPGLK